MDKVRKCEASREQASQMVTPSQEPGAARGRKCSKCSKYGHYASCCKGGRNLKPGKQGNTQQRGGRQQRHGKGKQANHVEGHCNESGEDDSFAFTIEEQSCAMSNSAEPVISVKIGVISRDVLIDSSSASNLISKDTLQELKKVPAYHHPVNGRLTTVSNIADDLILHGRDTDRGEDDKNLHSVLQRLSEKQLTLNAKNCSFRMTKVVFMSLLLSKHGIGPTKEKVRAVAEASQPQTP
ncbi:hypothetical protein AWC38_SpisGene22635 [Stylophora pistillata]|uniref:Uncharacterized protein n=1 Tax=Stylophora pistillata TaxID=50429 RepID=A0A2B4R6N0_STYPI|nr:hypothetical protein AWC38_SpisGene22635 [Stylophora pistillata]